jgi:hypothetical protein
MPKRVLVLIAVLIFWPFVHAMAMDQEKHDNIAAILNVTGSINNSKVAVDGMLPQVIDLLRKANPEIPKQVLDGLEKEGREEFLKALPDLVEPLIAIYDANFSAGEIRELLAFYRTPLGQKLIAQTPQIIQQGMAMGAVWGQRVAPRVVERIRASAKQKGYDL